MQLSDFNTKLTYHKLLRNKDGIGGYSPDYSCENKFWCDVQITSKLPNFMSKREYYEEFFIVRIVTENKFRRGDVLRNDQDVYEIEKVISNKEGVKEILVVRVYE